MFVTDSKIYKDIVGQDHLKDKIKIDYRTIGTASGYGYDRQSASFDHLMGKHGFNIENVDGVGSCAVERWLTETFANTKVIKVLY